jgi:RNA polymerase sigma-70 factor (ECF subfamily)
MNEAHAEDFEDAEILQRVAENLDDYFHLLWEKYGRIVFAVAQGLLDNPQDAEEAVVDTFMQSYRSLPRLIERGQTILLRPWLITIVTHSCQNRKRHDGRLRRPPHGLSLDTDDGKKLAESTLCGFAPSAEDEAIQHENNDELYCLLRQLPQRQRVIVLLYYIAGLSGAEIASILGSKPEAIKKERERALKKLRAKEPGKAVRQSFLAGGRDREQSPL